MSVGFDGVVEIVPVVIDTFVNAPLDGVIAPIAVLFNVDPVIAAPEIVPPVIATELAFCVDRVPNPVMSVLGIVALAVMADVPLPLT